MIRHASCYEDVYYIASPSLSREEKAIKRHEEKINQLSLQLKKTNKDLEEMRTEVKQMSEHVRICMETIRCFPGYGQDYKASKEHFESLSKE